MNGETQLKLAYFGLSVTPNLSLPMVRAVAASLYLQVSAVATGVPIAQSPLSAHQPSSRTRCVRRLRMRLPHGSLALPQTRSRSRRVPGTTRSPHRRHLHCFQHSGCERTRIRLRMVLRRYHTCLHSHAHSRQRRRLRSPARSKDLGRRTRALDRPLRAQTCTRCCSGCCCRTRSP